MSELKIGYTNPDLAPLTTIGEEVEMPTFLKRGGPDCKVEVVVVPPLRRVSPEVAARRINAECAELLAKWQARRTKAARTERKARKAKRDMPLSEHRS